MSNTRRNLFKWIAGFGSAVVGTRALAHHTDTHFEDDSAHHIIYQCNSADNEYLSHNLFSIGALLRKYGDDIEIVVACFGPGLNLLGKRPIRPIPIEFQKRVESLAEYGVSFHACGNTMKALRWTKDDLLDISKVVPVGVEDMMLLQEKGFSYISW